MIISNAPQISPGEKSRYTEMWQFAHCKGGIMWSYYKGKIYSMEAVDDDCYHNMLDAKIAEMFGIYQEDVAFRSISGRYLHDVKTLSIYTENSSYPNRKEEVALNAALKKFDVQEVLYY